MKIISGESQNIKHKIIGVFCSSNNLTIKKRVLFAEKEPFISFGVKAIITTNLKMQSALPVFYIYEKPDLNDGDIISIHPNGKIVVEWEPDSAHNFLFLTDLCNSSCIMCPQVGGTSAYYDDCIEIINLVDFSRCEYIGISGGEPTLDFDKFISVLKAIEKKAPGQKVHVLTNGRQFNEDNVRRIFKIKNLEISFGIPLYSYIPEEHDYIVGSEGAFEETVKGFYNLAKYRYRIEIRVVVLRQNFLKLRELARFIYRNFPFVYKVAIMGMEYHGNAEINNDIISIDPIEYKNEVFEAVRDYVRYGMLVQLYNMPLCLTEDRIHRFCVDSISPWKKTYLSECENCKVRENCCGLFATSFIHSKNIKAFL